MQTVEKTSGRSKKLLPFLLTGTVAAASVVAMSLMDSSWESVTNFKASSAYTEQSKEDKLRKYRVVVPPSFEDTFVGAASLPYYEKVVMSKTKEITRRQTYGYSLQKDPPRKVYVTGYIFSEKTVVFEYSCFASPLKKVSLYDAIQVFCKEGKF